MKYFVSVIYVLFCLSVRAQQVIRYTPLDFSHLFTLNRTPVLTIRPGDTVETETVDALGFDQHGIKRTRGGNPLTGPFYIENAAAGDVLAVTLTKVALNRPYSYTSEYFASRSMTDSINKIFKRKGHLVKWKLDLKKGLAWPDSTTVPYPNLVNFTVPLHPFPGCIGVAPGNKKNEVLSFFQGSYGGNLDYRGIAQGATLYLPVFHDGGYLYLGDGHAVQGDGEIAGNALETSMDIEFTVRIIKKEVLHLAFPRAEDSTWIMAIGVDKKMDKAIKIAGAGLLDWLQQDYHLSLEEATQVMSTTIEYTVAEIADPAIVMVAKIKKERLKGLQQPAASIVQ